MLVCIYTVDFYVYNLYQLNVNKARVNKGQLILKIIYFGLSLPQCGESWATTEESWVSLCVVGERWDNTEQRKIGQKFAKLWTGPPIILSRLFHNFSRPLQV